MVCARWVSEVITMSVLPKKGNDVDLILVSMEKSGLLNFSFNAI